MTLKESLDLFSKINCRFLLITFLALSILLFAAPGGAALPVNPLSWELLSLLIVVPLSYALVYVWFVEVIGRLDATLSESDIASYGPLIGCSLLAVAVLIAFSYLSSHPEGLALTVLGKRDFIHFCTLFLLASETMRAKR